MGKIYEEIKVNDKKVKVKVDTGSDLPLCLRKDVIEKLKLKKHPTAIAKFFTEEKGYVESPTYFANIRLKKCNPYPVVVVEATGENLLGHPVLQVFEAKIDEKKEELIIDKCPVFRTGEVTGKIIEK